LVEDGAEGAEPAAGEDIPEPPDPAE
jgi:hypothetical protein